MPSHRFVIEPRLPALIFLNGPAGSGKSTLADHLATLDRGVAIYHHASPLWAMLDQIVLGPEDSPMDFSDPAVKLSPLPWAGPGASSSPLTYRDALVSLGNWVRATFGPETLSRLASESTRDLLVHHETVVYPAVRTLEDISRLVPAAGPQNCILVRIFRDGYSWDGDLGGYLEPATLGIPHVDVFNNSTIEDFFFSALSALGIEP